MYSFLSHGKEIGRGVCVVGGGGGGGSVTVYEGVRQSFCMLRVVGVFLLYFNFLGLGGGRGGGGQVLKKKAWGSLFGCCCRPFLSSSYSQEGGSVCVCVYHPPLAMCSR